MYEYTFPPGYLDRFSEHARDGAAVELLEHIRAHGTSREILSVAAATAVRDGAVGQAAATALDALFSRVDPNWIADHTENLRGIAGLTAAPRGIDLPGGMRAWLTSVAGAASKRASRRTTWSIQAVMSFSPNGYWRERAVRRLARRSDGAELPFLLLRRNDWVPQVREVAADELEQRVRPDYAVHWARCLGLLDRIAVSGRTDHGPFVRRVLGLLLAAEGRPATLAALDSVDRRTRRAAARLLVSGALPDSDLDALLATTDPMIWLAAGRAAWRDPTTERARTMAARLATHRFAPLAAEALVALTEIDADAAQPLLENALLSKRAVLRRVAAHRLAQKGIDIEARYAEVLLDDRSPPRDVAFALAGFAAHTSAAEADMARAFLGHENAGVRREAVRAIGRLAPDDIEAFIRALFDPASTVAKAGAAALSRRPSVVPVDVYLDAATNAPSDAGRNQGIALAWAHADGLSPTTRVDMAADATGHARHTALRHLEQWLRYGIVPAAWDDEGVRPATLAAFRRRAKDLPEDLVHSAEHDLPD